jgi:hypothetical protein
LSAIVPDLVHEVARRERRGSALPLGAAARRCRSALPLGARGPVAGPFAEPRRAAHEPAVLAASEIGGGAATRALTARASRRQRLR